MLPEHPDVLIQVRSYDWHGDNRHIAIYDVYSPATLMGCSIGGCTCSGACNGYYAYESNGASGHTQYIRCDGCGKESFLTSTQSHSFSGNTCRDCGYTKSGGSSGGGTDPCYHPSTRTTWSGCDWYKYCNNCSNLVDWGTTHGAVLYGSWQYYNASQHRRTSQCRDCREDLGYDYGYHSPTNSYSPYNDAQHKVTSSCSICGTAIGSATYENHSDSNGDGSCDACGYSLSVTVTWNAGSNGGTVGGSSSVTTTVTSGSVATPPSGIPVKTGYTFTGWFTEAEGGTEVTGSTIYTTDSESVFYAHWTRVMVFSATVPVTLPMSVSENGTVHTATNHAIQNNSTGAIAVTGITVTAANGWSLVPVDTDMAAQKVDAKLLGFSLNGAETTARGDTQALSLAGGGWTIPEADALALDYDAVVSAMSKAVTDEAVLSVVFVLEWA